MRIALLFVTACWSLLVLPASLAVFMCQRDVANIRKCPDASSKELVGNGTSCSLCARVSEDPEPIEDCYDICSSSDSLIPVYWTYPSHICDATCRDEVQYRTCTSDSECPESHCCALAGTKNLLAELRRTKRGCGYSSCWCSEDGLVCTSDCRGVGNGLCIREEESDPKNGMFCQPSRCVTDIHLLYKQCSFDGTYIASTDQGCAGACQRAVYAFDSCTEDPLVKMYSSWHEEHCTGCENLLYKTCQSDEDCPSHMCCALPDQEILESGVTCGPARALECHEGRKDLVGCTDITTGTCVRHGDFPLSPGWAFGSYSCVSYCPIPGPTSGPTPTPGRTLGPTPNPTPEPTTSNDATSGVALISCLYSVSWFIVDLLLVLLGYFSS